MRKNEILLKTCQEEKLRKELEETRKCEAEVARRNKINAARIALEKKHFDEKQSMRNLLSDKASEELKQRAMREFEIFERDRQMRYQKELEKAEAARKKQEADKIAIEECRKNQIKYKMEQIEVDMKLGKLYVDELNRINKEKQESGRQKELAKRQQNLEIRKIQQQQCEENERRRVQENAELLRQEQHVSSVRLPKLVLSQPY